MKLALGTHFELSHLHPLSHSSAADLNTLLAQFRLYARGTIGSPALDVDSFDHCGQGFVFLDVLTFWPFEPGKVATLTHLEHVDKPARRAGPIGEQAR